MTFISQAQALASKRDLPGLTNLINAELTAKERGISIVTAKEFNVAFDLESELKRKGEAA
ncbi:hypothetical protein [Devosia sp.]|uniref:hypothetical protein n=1 Tax=Devosia sp. TaxID=1871048 RepID=UPI002AFF970F|nr:hypothetical protein [Devosia sp.]